MRGFQIMASSVEGVTSTQDSTSNSGSSYYSAYEAYGYNPESGTFGGTDVDSSSMNSDYQKGIENGMKSSISQDKKSEQQNEQQIQELYESQGQTAPKHAGSF